MGMSALVYTYAHTHMLTHTLLPPYTHTKDVGWGQIKLKCYLTLFLTFVFSLPRIGLRMHPPGLTRE